jgi:hypothetical protein
MNKAYEVIDNKVIVYDEYYSESTREYTNNIEEILITENNIEEINELIENEAYNNRKRSTMESVVPAWLGVATSQLILSIPKFISNNIGGAIGHVLSSICFFTLSFFCGIRPTIKRNKLAHKRINFLEKKLQEEEKKLNELNKDKTNDLMYAPEEEKKISRSVQIDILKSRLRDINLYMEHKHKIIKLYKKGLLENELFEACASRDTINFIIELVKNDLNEETKSKNNKVKVYANDIEYGNI